ncbi:GNAT family N-acetyltransferase [Lactococcus lactis]|uniref:GNAT family N-acetyltransferase n=1 Tax=Lactococcus lactis TaxID=1358 RepID=UPI00050D65AE|nr:N-acetyltransferase [Lactococcus lactis]AIS03163.1 Acetyltransferase, GNAT family [Lactococcus lactis]RHJ28370.1 N-acetyltransferase [Lactococcus lactis]
MNSLIFEQVFQQKEDFLPILLLADDGPHLENYLENGDLFTLSLKNDKTVACAVVIKKQKNTYEIENFAVETSFQGQGFGQEMMKQLITYLKENLAADELILGTDDVSNNVAFYEKCGFTITHKISNYFLDNYDHPIFEGKIQLKDKIYLRKKLK